LFSLARSYRSRSASKLPRPIIGRRGLEAREGEVKRGKTHFDLRRIPLDLAPSAKNLDTRQKYRTREGWPEDADLFCSFGTQTAR
jgi:hypothetical protein